MSTTSASEKDHGYEPQSKLWKQIPQQAAGYNTLRFAGLFNLPIPLRFAFGIGVSTIKKWPSAASNVRYALTQESSSAGSLIGLSRLSRMAYAHTARHMRGFTGKKAHEA